MSYAFRSEEALTLTGHKCRAIAVAQWNDEGRDCWIGELLEPIADAPEETHCLHLRSPIKGEIVFGVTTADLLQWAALATIVCQAAYRANALRVFGIGVQPHE